jgi:hypothetical protein
MTATLSRQDEVRVDFRVFDADNHYYEAEDACSGPRSTASVVSWSAVG